MTDQAWSPRTAAKIEALREMLSPTAYLPGDTDQNVFERWLYSRLAYALHQLGAPTALLSDKDVLDLLFYFLVFEPELLDKKCVDAFKNVVDDQTLLSSVAGVNFKAHGARATAGLVNIDSMAIFGRVLRIGHAVASHESLHALEALRRGPILSIDIAPRSFMLIDECSQTNPQTLGKMLELLGDREVRCTINPDNPAL